MLNGKKVSWPSGGLMSHCARSSTTPPRTFTRPTEHAEAALLLAVSKSMAVKSTGTETTLAHPADTWPRTMGDSRLSLPGRLDPRGSNYRNRGSAQRRQIDPVQRAHP